MSIKPLAFIANAERQPNATDESIQKMEADNQSAIERYVTSAKVIRPVEVAIADRRPRSKSER